MKTQNHLEFLSIPQFKEIPGLVHGFGTKDFILENLLRTKEIKDFKTVTLQQVHSDIVRIIKSEMVEKKKGDALITQCPDLLLIIRTADCLPVFIVDKSRRVAAAVHCGWRGTSKWILSKTLEKMESEFGCRPEELLAGLGPCIGQNCYEVGRDVFEAFQDQNALGKGFKRIPGKPDKFLMDLRKINRQQLFDSGINKKNLVDPFLCSHCDSRFFSHRKAPENKERMINFIGWKR